MGVSGQPLRWSWFLGLGSFSSCVVWLLWINFYAFLFFAWDAFLFGTRRFSLYILGVLISLHFIPSHGSLISVSTELSDGAVRLGITGLGAVLQFFLFWTWHTANAFFWSLQMWPSHRSRRVGLCAGTVLSTQQTFLNPIPCTPIKLVLWVPHFVDETQA